MPKPKGTCGATKMKIMAVIYTHQQLGKLSYGYNIWLCLKANFFVYMNDSDIRNVYHHLNDLKGLGYIMKCPYTSVDVKQCYKITEKGNELKTKYDPFLVILEGCSLN